LLLKDLKMNL